MFKNHLKIAWRSLKKQPFFTFLNTFGLAIGMAGALLISLYIYDELTYDTMFADAERIYRIDTDFKFGGAEIAAAEAAAPMAGAMKIDFPQVEQTVRFRERGSMLIRKTGTQENTKERSVTFVDSTFIDFFGLELLEGNAGTALTRPNTLVLTESAARRQFGNQNALGQNVLLNNTDTYTVTGVVKDLPENSFLREHSVFMAMAGYEDSRSDNWGSQNYFTFIKLDEGTNLSEFKSLLQGMVDRYMLPWGQQLFPGITAESFAASGNYIRYDIIPLTDIHLYSNRQSEMSANGSIQTVYILTFIAFFLIVLASVNYMNLSTAHSLKRAKEVGVRKTLGSNKRDLVRQFLTESGLISLFSLLLAVIITITILPFFNALSGKTIAIPYSNLGFWAIILIAALLLGVLSGSYPSFFMSRFMPVKTLKDGGQKEAGGGGLRNTLVVIQFTISIFLMIATLVVFKQVDFMQGKDLGYTKDQVVIIEDTYAAGSNIHTFKEELLKLGQVQSATLSSFMPTPSARSNSSFFKEGYYEQENAIQIQTWSVDEDYTETLGMNLIAGRNFDLDYGTDSTAVIINEAALPILGVGAEEALGMRITQDGDVENSTFSTIIGVVKDFHFESLRKDIGALGLFMGQSTGNMAVKLSAGDFPNTLASVENIWERVAPGQPLSYRFMDDSFNSVYEAEQRLAKIFTVFSILSIIIACLGLFGLAAFNAQKRTKEIGVRKVLGASVTQISVKLTMDFLKLVGVAILISLPLGWYAMNKWLEDFSYKIDIPWWVFLLAAVLAVGVAVVTVSYQSIKASIVNPVKSLRTD